MKCGIIWAKVLLPMCFFIINMDIQNSLYTPQLISQILKLTTM